MTNNLKIPHDHVNPTGALRAGYMYDQVYDPPDIIGKAHKTTKLYTRIFLIIKINAQHSALSKAIKTRFKIEIIYCDVSS